MPTSEARTSPRPAPWSEARAPRAPAVPRRLPRPSPAGGREACGARSGSRARTRAPPRRPPAPGASARSFASGGLGGASGASIGSRARLECSRLGAPDHQHEARRLLGCDSGGEGAGDRPGLRRLDARRPRCPGGRERPGPPSGTLAQRRRHTHRLLGRDRRRGPPDPGHQRGPHRRPGPLSSSAWADAEAPRRRARGIHAPCRAVGGDRNRPLRLRGRDHQRRPRCPADHEPGVERLKGPGRPSRRPHRAAPCQAARDQRRGAALAVALRLPAGAEPAAVFHLLLQRARGAGPHNGDPPRHVDRRGPPLVHTGTRRPGGGRPGARHRDLVPRRQQGRLPRTVDCLLGHLLRGHASLGPRRQPGTVRAVREAEAPGDRGGSGLRAEGGPAGGGDRGGDAMSPSTAVARARPEVITEEVPRRRPAWVERATSTNHKSVGILYLGGALFFAAIAVVELVLLRVQLIVPENTAIQPQIFDRIMSTFGVTAVVLFAIPLAFGLISYVVPLQIGSRSVAFPRLNLLSFWLYLMGAATIYGSFLYRPSEAGFAALPTLSENIFLGTRGVDTWVVGTALAVLGFVCFSVNLVVTLHNMRAPGMAWRRVPLFTWAAGISGYLMLVIGPVMLAALTMLFIDRHYGGVFFNAGEGGAPLLYEHL